MITLGFCTVCFTETIGWFLYAVPVSDFLPGLIRSVQFEAASIKNRLALFSMFFTKQSEATVCVEESAGNSFGWKQKNLKSRVTDVLREDPFYFHSKTITLKRFLSSIQKLIQ